jgi:hypothetical protein
MGMLLSIVLVLVISGLTVAQGGDRMRSQGRVDQLDLKKGKMEVNETIITWNQGTIFNDEKGNPVSVEKLSTKSWVFIEGEYDEVNKRLVAQKIYLLPKYIDKKERHRYPFMQ